ncbi:MAG: transposase [Pyrinomonadaceae bacterium]|nr:transposase [Pyrinomonadaceae bacterium]
MKESKFTEEQIIAILRQAATGEQTIGAVCREHSIAENTFYKWRQKYGGMEVSEARRLRELEKENARLKRLLAERCIEIDAMKEVIAKKW